MGQPAEPIGDPVEAEGYCPMCGAPIINGKVNHAQNCPLREQESGRIEPGVE
jgi:hypothetical protein